MHEYYRAKAENSQDWQKLEYRGDSSIYDEYSEMGYTREEIWQKYEPRKYLRMGLAFLLPCFFFALLLILNSIIFMIHEWYHLTYLPNKQKEAYLNMKIEMEKARQQYNNGNISQEAPRVKGL